MYFKRVRIVTKSTCYLPHVCPSSSPHVSARPSPTGRKG